MKIYVASSWRNDYQPDVVKLLRQAGHEVYDFRNPTEGNHGFAWSDIDPDWLNWSPTAYVEAMKHPIAEDGFKSDFDAMKWADACVMVLPCGRSANTEAGWMKGAGKPVYVFQPIAQEPELMYKIYDDIIVSFDELERKAIGDWLKWVPFSELTATHYLVPDNSNAFVDWIMSKNIGANCEGHFTSIPFRYEEKVNDIWALAIEFALYREYHPTYKKRRSELTPQPASEREVILKNRIALLEKILTKYEKPMTSYDGADLDFGKKQQDDNRNVEQGINLNHPYYAQQATAPQPLSDDEIKDIEQHKRDLPFMGRR